MKRTARKATDFEENEFAAPKAADDLSNYVDISMAITKYISDYVNSHNFKQKDIALKLGKHESEISKWFNGFHNLTLKSIIKLESVSNIRLLNPEILNVYNKKIELTFTTPPIAPSKDRKSMINEMYAQTQETLGTEFIKSSNNIKTAGEAVTTA